MNTFVKRAQFDLVARCLYICNVIEKSAAGYLAKTIVNKVSADMKNDYFPHSRGICKTTLK